MGQLLKKHIKNEKGLTLIELLAVIVILGIIAAIAIPSIANIIEKSRFDAVKADAVQILNGAQTYVSSNDYTTGTLDEDELGDFVENVTTFEDGYTVTVGDSGLTFSGTGQKGNVTIKFNNANLSTINSATKSGKSNTIGTTTTP
ncbi:MULTISPECIES: prepilin-type N-terminal cleavage/methylation domain-containing protein [Bacillaceae]|uniref:prepilin-type N-terminal cleavage/methylation domain-containing protein n=1 Tax=Bacillaceae TaxID=186817 RepID=UPI001E2EDEB6|nr:MULTISPECIES: prepilin-type N-terminal cleavage/methylation domain-containing protein [Bacillaceae]MCE4051598.1 prepilin-type N-terminal cleavage/methylation domain-containing protein [Bacillus sp. Au-Bac7]MCM3029973.1 prepilin-type N-terminal cleavage/methylation domain-containing protein [Niallia sp. MER 6]